jgi:hypothetical protein
VVHLKHLIAVSHVKGVFSQCPPDESLAIRERERKKERKKERVV